MPLVEIIHFGESSERNHCQSRRTGQQKMEQEHECSQRLPRLAVNRVLFPYFAGFQSTAARRRGFHKVDKVMEKQFGWPMGPAYLLDVVGIDTAHHAQAAMAGFPRMQKEYRDAIGVLFDASRFGRKRAGTWRCKDGKGRRRRCRGG